jgi:hypothetical protein
MMANLPPQGVDKYLDREVVTSDGAKLGIAAKLLKNRVSEIPAWIVVEAGLLGRKRYVVPLAGSELNEDSVLISYSNDQVTAAPQAEPDDETDTLTPDDEDALDRHFNLGA